MINRGIARSSPRVLVSPLLWKHTADDYPLTFTLHPRFREQARFRVLHAFSRAGFRVVTREYRHVAMEINLRIQQFDGMVFVLAGS